MDSRSCTDTSPLLFDDLSSSFSSSTLLCIHCEDDKEVIWICQDCGGEFCDKCKRIHLISDTESRNHRVSRYGTKRISGSLKPDVSHEESVEGPTAGFGVHEVNHDVNNPPEVNVNEYHEFECRSGMADNKTVQHIHFLPGGSGEAWVKCGAISDEILLYSTDGRIIDRRKFKSPIQDFVITRKESIMFTNYNKNSISICQPNENLREFAKLSFTPGPISLLAGNNILVSSATGLQSFQKIDEHAHTVPFSTSCQLQEVYNMAENSNGDICITEKGGWGSGRVVCLTSSGDLRFHYKGQGRFDPSGITCDEGGFIYVCDVSKQNVHVLDKDGKFVSFLFPDSFIQNPEAVAVRGRRCVWIGDGSGKVRIFNFIK